MKSTNRIAALISALALATLGAVALGSQQQASPTGVDKDVASRQRAAYLRSGLQAAAQVTGTYTERIPFNYFGGPVSLQELAALSHAIIIGTVQDNVCRPTLDGRSIVTLHTVQVETSLGGSILFKAGERLTFAVPGGRINFTDGTTAQVNAVGFRLPTRDQRLVLFLRRADQNVVSGNEAFIQGGAFVPTSGPLGVYPLTLTNRRFVQPAGYPTSELATTLYKQKLDPYSFVEAVRSVVRDSAR